MNYYKEVKSAFDDWATWTWRHRPLQLVGAWQLAPSLWVGQW